MIRGLLALAALAAAAPAAAQPARLERRGDATQLIVDGKPFLILGGELGNSSASDREWLRPHWAALRAMHLNTLLAPVSWELIEPEEGRFDWATVDWLLADARANDMHLVLLWFGAWKNSMSSYAPAWVKRDSRRFPRAAGPDGKPQELLSAFGAATLEADRAAFVALMAHLKQADPMGTVVMVQVENEIGFLPSAREQGAAADAAFAGPVPAALRGVLATASPRETWRQLAQRTHAIAIEEAFTAWTYARYVEAIAAAGKRADALPMYVNGAQPRPGKLPGDYPSGGPLAHLAVIWRAGAPSIDLLAPDIYFPDFAEIAAGYRQQGLPILVPEANRAGDPRAPANAAYVFGALGGIGFSPFAIESLDGADAARLGEAYAALGSIAPQIAEAQAAGRITGFAPRVAFDGTVDEAPQRAILGPYALTVRFVDPWTPREKQQIAEHGGMILWLGGEDYLVAGTGITVTVEPADGQGRAGLDRVEEGSFVDGAWRPGRRLNGDETHQGRHVRLPPGAFAIQKVRLYRY